MLVICCHLATVSQAVDVVSLRTIVVHLCPLAWVGLAMLFPDPAFILKIPWGGDFIFVLCVVVFCWQYFCAHMCALLIEAEREHWILWDWSLEKVMSCPVSSRC